MTNYLSLVPAEHTKCPNFMALLAAILQQPVDNQNALSAMASDLFDVAVAAGDQLDTIGEWAGASRNISVPLTGVYFAWGVAGLGWGEGTWLGPYDSTTGLAQLPDDSYRQLLFAVIAKNYWNGTVPGAYAVWALAFAGSAGSLLIQDNQDCTILIVFLGNFLTAVVKALIANQYFDLCPAGVQIEGYFTSSVPGAPVFGWGIENASIAGWGTGAWMTEVASGNTLTGVGVHGDVISMVAGDRRGVISED